MGFVQDVGKIEILHGKGVMAPGVYNIFVDKSASYPTLLVKDGEDVLHLEDLVEDGVEFVWL